MTVTVPEGTHGDVKIRRFTVGRTDSRISFLTGRGRGVHEGTYTGLYIKGALWMSDTRDEKFDHLTALHEAVRRQARRVLVNGLGIGMVVSALLGLDHVEHVDVVEASADVIALVGAHYEAMAAAAGKTITIHHADAFDIKWPQGSRWDIVWHDIWKDLCTENLDEMGRLHRSYGRRCGWQGSWGKEILQRQRRVERAEDERYEMMARILDRRFSVAR